MTRSSFLEKKIVADAVKAKTRASAFHPTEKQIDVIAQMWAQKVSGKLIAAHFGTTYHQITNLVRKDRQKFPKREFVGPVELNDRVCGLCESIFTTKWTRRIYCEDCSADAMEINRQSQLAQKMELTHSALGDIAKTMGKQTTRITDVWEKPGMLWSTAFSVPYSLDASKNRRFGMNGTSVFLLKGVRKWQDYLIAETRRAVSGRKIANNKVWVSIYVEKPDHRSDAINVVDTICDAVKKGLEIDDRWFSLGQVDWCVKKNDPSIIISIGQESKDDVLVCSHCGDIKLLDQFPKNKSGPLGRSRSCIECKRTIEKARRAA